MGGQLFANLERLHLHFDKDLPVHGRILTYDEELAIVQAYKKSPEALREAAMKFCAQRRTLLGLSGASE